VTAGVVLSIVPSLALAADQVSKIDNVLEKSVTAIHLDDVTDTVNRAKVKSILDSLSRDSDMTVFIFSSPQAIISNTWLNTIHGLIERGVLKAVVVDELHLFTQFGSYFRPEFPSLKKALFSRLVVRHHFDNSTESDTQENDGREQTHSSRAQLLVPVVLMTATIDKPHLILFSKMSGLPVHPDNWLWARASDMQRRDIDFRLDYSSQFTKLLKKFAATYFKDDDKCKLMVYSNSRSAIEKVQTTFDFWLDEEQPFKGDTVAINGSLFKEQKFHRANVFNEEFDLDRCYCRSDPCPRVGFFTAGTIGAGYDNNDVKAVFRQGWPMEKLSAVQEAGRNRNAGVYMIVSSFDSYLYLLRRMYLPSVSEDNHITPAMEAVLTVAEQKKLQTKLLNAFVSVVVLNYGCWHVALERFKGNPLLPTDDLQPCVDHCPRCRGELNPGPSNHYKPVLRDGLVLFLVETFINNPTGRVTPGDLIKKLHDFEDVGKKVYARPRSSKPFSMISCEFTIFQLILSNIITR